MCTHTWQWLRDDNLWSCILCGKIGPKWELDSAAAVATVPLKTRGGLLTPKS